MFRNKDVLLIKNVDSEYIDKIIIILNEHHKNVIPEEHIIHQAENIVKDYAKKHPGFRSKISYRISQFALAGIFLGFLALLIYQRFF